MVSVPTTVYTEAVREHGCVPTELYFFGHGHLNHIEFSYVTNYSSFDFFQPLKNVKAILKLLSCTKTEGQICLPGHTSPTPVL